MWPTGTTRSFEPLPRARSTPSSRSTSATSQPDRLRRAQPAGVHQLEQRPVAQVGGLGALGLVEQLVHLAAGEHLGQLAPAARRGDAGGGVGRRARPRAAGGGRRSAGRPPCGGSWPATPPGRSRPPSAARKSLDLGAGRVHGRRCRAPRGSGRTGAGRSGRPRACCATARARTRGRRGSRAPGARTGARRPGWATVAMRRASPARGPPLGAASSRSAALAQERPEPEQPDQRLRVAQVGDRRVQLARPAAGRSRSAPPPRPSAALVVEVLRPGTGGSPRPAGPASCRSSPGGATRGRPCRSPRRARACAVASRSSPSTSILPAGSSSSACSPTGSRGWRTSQIRSPSNGSTVTAPGWLDDLARGLLAVVVAEGVHAHAADVALPDLLAGDALEAIGSSPGPRVSTMRQRHVEHPSPAPRP